jgi:hypothetical protein
MLPENVAVDKVLQILEFKNRSASYVEEIVAFVSHARGPDFRIRIPGISRKFVGIRLNIHMVNYKPVI